MRLGEDAMRSSTICPCCAREISLFNAPPDYMPHWIRCPHCRSKVRVRMRGMAAFWSCGGTLVFGFMAWLLFSGLASRGVAKMFGVVVAFAAFRSILLVYFNFATFSRPNPPPFIQEASDKSGIAPSQDSLVYEGTWLGQRVRYELDADELTVQANGENVRSPLASLLPDPIHHRELTKPFLLGLVLLPIGVLCWAMGYLARGRPIPASPVAEPLLLLIPIGLLLALFSQRRKEWCRFLDDNPSGPQGWVDVMPLKDSPYCFGDFVLATEARIRLARSRMNLDSAEGAVPGGN